MFTTVCKIASWWRAAVGHGELSLAVCDYLGWDVGMGERLKREVINAYEYRKVLWRKEWQPTPVFLPGESQGQKSLVGYS